jgi:hypothetical protein
MTGSARAGWLVALVALSPSWARADEAPPPAERPPSPRLVQRLEAEPGLYARIFGTLSLGKGIRFNNPYRLSTVAGDDAASVSFSAAYVDVAANVLFGEPDGAQHGGAVHVGSSVEGIGQPFVAPSYVLAYRADLPVMVYGRVGPVILLAPDANVGGEMAASVSYFFLAGLGLTSELTFDLFYGAATLTEQYSVIPVLSLQMGVIADYEFLP